MDGSIAITLIAGYCGVAAATAGGVVVIFIEIFIGFPLVVPAVRTQRTQY